MDVRAKAFASSNCFPELKPFLHRYPIQLRDTVGHDELHRACESLPKSRVPDTFQLGAILPCSAFLASRKINNLCVFNRHEYSDSPRLHHIKASVINKLQRCGCARVPDEFHGRPGTGGRGNGITSTSSGIRYRKRMDVDG